MMKTLLSSIVFAALVNTASADVTTTVTNKVDAYKASRAFMGAVVVVVDHGAYY